ncbi:MAG: polyprenol monophosphomannose synthase [Deltaproteobacteria bacterium]|nr:MAG: polyprenol monophosphomannose synthase [Deltaproteobacteria bacterium]
MAPRILIVTPTYDERENLEPFLAGAFEALPEAHVLVVDDNSPDGTGDLADSIAAEDPRVQVMHRPGKLGLGSAYLDAFRWGLERDYEIILEMDTDLSHDPRYLPDFIQAIEDGAGVVIGSRNVPGGGVEGWGLGRHVLSKGGSLYSRSILGLSVRDLTSGYKAFRADVLRAISLDEVHSEGYSFQIELTYRSLRKGFRVQEVPIIFVDRRAGESKMSRKIFAEAIMMVWKLRFDALTGKF